MKPISKTNFKFRFCFSYYSIILILFSILLSCSNEPAKTIINCEEIKVPKDITKTIDLSDITDSIDYLLLTTDSNDLIGEISKLIYYKNSFYILDSKYSNSLLKFNIHGVLSAKYTPSKGPFWGSSILDFSINNNKIYAYNIISQSILILDTNLCIIKTINVECAAKNIEAINDYLVLYTNKMITDESGANEILLFSHKGKLIKRFLNFDKNKYIGYSPENVLNKYGTNISIFTSLRDTIYCLKNKKLYSRYNLLFNNPLPNECKNDILKLSLINKKCNFLINNFIETNDWIYFNYSEDCNIKDIFISKLSKSKFFYHHITNFAFGQNYIAKPKFSVDNKFIFILNNIENWVPDSTNISRLEKLKFRKLLNLKKFTNYNSNFILMFVKLKKL